MTLLCDHTQIEIIKHPNWRERIINFSKLIFVHLITEVDAGLGTHTHTHAHTNNHVHTCHVCYRYNIFEQKCTDPTTAVSFIYIAYFYVCMLSLLSCSLSSSHTAFVVRSFSTMGCRSSSRSRCLLLSGRSQNKEEMDRQKRRERGKERWGVQEGQKQGKKEKPKREKTKNIATGC